VRRIDFRQVLLSTCQREFEAASSGASQEGAGEAAEGRLPGNLLFLTHLFLQGVITER
jgi:hypothetical protein